MMTITAPRLGFAGNDLRRDGETRGPEEVAAARVDPRARLLLSWPGGRWLFRGRDPLFTFEAARTIGFREADAILLGFRDDGCPLWAGRAEAEAEAPPPDCLDALPLRGLAQDRLVDAQIEGALGHAAHLLNWHRGARFCGYCGAPTRAEAGGIRRRCTACERQVFPRTDPVSIMLVHDGAGRCVLGRQPHFAPSMWSCLAGFVEAGETLEDAVRRETLEEAGLVVREVEFRLSQPWPFPGSLMLGCMARAEPGEIRFDRTELEDCRWFARDEVRAMLADTHQDGLQTPAPVAIAHHLVQLFADGQERQNFASPVKE